MSTKFVATVAAVALNISCVGEMVHEGYEEGDGLSQGRLDRRSDQEDRVPGALIHEIKNSDTAWVRFYQQEDGALLTEFAADVDEDPEFLELSRRAMEKGEPLATFETLQPGRPAPLALRNAAARHVEALRQAEHRRGRTPRPDDESRPSEGTPGPDDWTGPEPEPEGGEERSAATAAGWNPGAENQQMSLVHKSVEPPWDWNADAQWWRDNFCSRHPSKPHRRCFTNQAWRTSGHFLSNQLSAQGLAASHVATAQFTGWQKMCNQCWLIGVCCNWRKSWDVTLQPRHWRAYNLINIDETAVEIFGHSPSERVHVSWQFESYPIW